MALTKHKKYMMDFTFFFCLDGQLRIQYLNQEPLIDAQFLIEEQFAGDNQKFWLRWRETPAVFEKGLTVGAFLKALEPHHEFWSDWCGKKIIEFIMEAKKPHLVQSEDMFDWIELRWHHYVSPRAEYYRDKSQNEGTKLNIKEMMALPTKVRMGGRVDFERYMAMTAYSEAECEHYGLTGVKINDIANTIICLKPRENIFIGNTHARKFPEMGSLVNREHVSVHKYNNENDKGIGEQMWLEADTFYTVADVIEGFFSEMEYSIEARDKNVAYLTQILTEFQNDAKYAEIKAAQSLEELDANVNKIIELEDAEEKNDDALSNVVSIKSGEALGRDEIEKIEVQYNPMEHLDQKSAWWLEMKKKYTLNAEIIKMAPKELGESPDNRIYGRPVEDEGKTTDWIDT